MASPTSSSAVKLRDSNMELLRIVAMFCVMVLHADFAALGQPNAELCVSAPGVTIFRYICEALSIVSVNVFVLLSGWFGIRPTWKGFLKFLFQVEFFSVGGWVIGCALGWSTWQATDLLTALLLTHPLYWFIPSYIGLFLLAPMLNAFIEKATSHQLGLTVLGFMLYQTVYGCLWSAPEGGQFQFGYSLISFVGLYLLAQYVRRYATRLTALPAAAHWALYIGCSMLVCGLGWIGARYTVDGMQTRALAYSNPLVVAAALFMLLGFSRLSFRSRVVNSIASTSFAVFLIHLNPWLYFQGFKANIILLSENASPGMATLAIIGFLLLVYLVAYLSDTIRQWIWHYLSPK